MKPDQSKPFYPAAYTEFDIASIKALFDGKASEQQQKNAVHWILFEACKIGDLCYRPDSARDTDFAEGKRFVGLQIVKLTKIPAGAATPRPAPPTRPGRK